MQKNDKGNVWPEQVVDELTRALKKPVLVNHLKAIREITNTMKKRGNTNV